MIFNHPEEKDIEEEKEKKKKTNMWMDGTVDFSD